MLDQTGNYFIRLAIVMNHTVCRFNIIKITVTVDAQVIGGQIEGSLSPSIDHIGPPNSVNS